jgi:hypothetical protein
LGIEGKLSPLLSDHEDFAGGIMAQGDGAVALVEAEDEGPRLGAVLDQFPSGMEVEPAFGQVTEERRILIDDADDAERLAGLE